MKKVAIFDVDGTIFRSSLVIELIEALVERELFPQEARDMYIREYKAWHDRKREYYDYIDAIVTAFLTYLKGLSYKDFALVAKEVIDEEEHRVYTYTRDLIQELKEEGYYLLAVSHSPKTILDEFCGRYGFDKVYGRVYELGPEDRFTGVVIDAHLIENKANILRRAVEKENLTLKGSIGVGDTESDISFLELVSKPIAFNPSLILYKHAKRLDWKVVVERKNVVYEL